MSYIILYIYIILPDVIGQPYWGNLLKRLPLVHAGGWCPCWRLPRPGCRSCWTPARSSACPPSCTTAGRRLVWRPSWQPCQRGWRSTSRPSCRLPCMPGGQRTDQLLLCTSTALAGLRCCDYPWCPQGRGALGPTLVPQGQKPSAPGSKP